MEQMATPGSVLMTADTLHLAEGYVQVKPLGPVAVKGMSEPVEVYEVTGAGVATNPAASGGRARTHSIRRARLLRRSSFAKHWNRREQGTVRWLR